MLVNSGFINRKGAPQCQSFLNWFVAAFKGKKQASEALDQLKKLEKSQTIQICNAAVLSKKCERQIYDPGGTRMWTVGTARHSARSRRV
jgi:uncharacterized membrane protein